MEIIQDGITYKIKEDLVIGWKGESPFLKPFYDVATGTIIESWTQADQDNKEEKEAKEDDKEAERLLRTVVWEGETKDGSYYLLTIKDDGKLESILIP